MAFFTVLLIEAVSFYVILTENKPSASADVVVVFHGDMERIEEGYRLVNKGASPLLIISPATETTLKNYDARYGHAGGWRHLAETRAETTFQNALLTGRLIRNHHFKNVILVTDAWHMPRSYLLIRMMLAGSRVKVMPVETPGTAYPRSPLKWRLRKIKHIYNEMVEFWGSISELALYKVRGELPKQGLKEKAWVKGLREVLLVDIS